jgi:hypothetical protein
MWAVTVGSAMRAPEQDGKSPRANAHCDKTARRAVRAAIVNESERNYRGWRLRADLREGGGCLWACTGNGRRSALFVAPESPMYF